MFKKFFKKELPKEEPQVIHKPLVKVSTDGCGTHLYYVIRKWDGCRYSYVTQTESQEELEKIVAHLSRPDIYI